MGAKVVNTKSIPINASINGLRILVLAALLAVAIMLALPRHASAASTRFTACGSMTVGVAQYKEVGIKRGSCSDARRLIAAFRTQAQRCSRQASLARVVVTCGRYKGMRSRVVTFQNTFTRHGGHLRVVYKGLVVDLHPRVVSQALDAPSRSTTADRRIGTRFGTAANGSLVGWIKGMAAEHEMITRAALSCSNESTVMIDPLPPEVTVKVKGVEDALTNCFEPRSLDNIAGYGSWTGYKQAGFGSPTPMPVSYGSAYTGAPGFGAIGAADNMGMRAMAGGPDWWHCDGADYLAPEENGGTTYPQDKKSARSRLAWCHDFAQMMMSSKLTGAYAVGCGLSTLDGGWMNPCTGMVPMAANLLDANGLARTGMDLKSACAFTGVQSTDAATVKCSVLEPFGYVLHAVTDFYSHSNYADAADPAKTVGIANPPGFRPSIAVAPENLPAFWDLSSGAMIGSIEADLFGMGTAWPITGCYPNSSCTGRVLHDNVLTKDLSGGIDYTKGANATIGAAGNPRGAINDNTLRAIRFAILEVRRQWEVAQKLLMQTYGEGKGAMMICALTRDTPTVCNS